MDPLSITASITALLQLTGAIITYLKAVHDASQDRITFLVEISGLDNLLDVLRKRIDEAKPGDPWLAEIRTLGFENGPLRQIESHLKRLASKLQPVGGLELKEVGRRLKWLFNKKDVEDTLVKIERIETLITLALTNNVL